MFFIFIFYQRMCSVLGLNHLDVLKHEHTYSAMKNRGSSWIDSLKKSEINHQGNENRKGEALI